MHARNPLMHAIIAYACIAVKIANQPKSSARAVCALVAPVRRDTHGTGPIFRNAARYNVAALGGFMTLGVCLLLIFALYLIDKHNLWRRAARLTVWFVVISLLGLGGIYSWLKY